MVQTTPGRLMGLAVILTLAMTIPTVVDVAHVIAGFSAKVVCSAVLLANRPMASLEEHVRSPATFVIVPGRIIPASMH